VHAEPHRDLHRDFLDGEVVELTGRRLPKRRDQHDVAIVEALADRLGVDATHLAVSIMSTPSTTPIGFA
jgi:hypothetical protein